jgi:hypothetical protein
VTRTILASLATCLALTAVPRAASAAIDCKSAYRDPTISYDEFRRRWERECRPAGIALAALTVRQAMVRMSDASFANVPTWSDADILAQFDAIRDRRYLNDSVHPVGDPRRITWMYPDDGCWARADQFAHLAGDAGKPKPHKLFAFGALRVITPNAESGSVPWFFHVVPVVKNPAGDPIVLDPSVEPCRPLYWRDWLALMTDNINNFDLGPAAGWGVTVGDSNAYRVESPVTGGPSMRVDSLADARSYLNEEWDRQGLLDRDPLVVLGGGPPWAGKACITTFAVNTSVSIPGNGTASAIAKCPRYATLAVGGGGGPQDANVLPTKFARNGNGWEVAARNRSSSPSSLWSEVTCLQRPGLSASVVTVTGPKVTIARTASNSSTATCSSSDRLVSGGFLTTVSGSPASAMTIFSLGRTTSTSGSWRAQAQNNASGSRDLTAYAYCLRNVSTTVTQVTDTFAGFHGEVAAYCPGGQLVTGGGYSFPRTSSYSMESLVNNLDGSFGVFTNPPADGDLNVKSNAECMTVP